MAKINVSQRQIFDDPSAIRRVGPTGTAGLEDRLAAERIRQSAVRVGQVANLAADLAAFGVDINTLLNQKHAGNYEVAKANAEARWTAEEQTATQPEPLASRMESTEGARQELLGSPFREQSDAELYAERYPKFLEDVTNIGKSLKGRSKKAYDLWVQTQAPEWQQTLASHYAKRVTDNAKTDYQIAIQSRVQTGDALEVARLYGEAIDNGVWGRPEIAGQMMKDISSAVETTVWREISSMADSLGYDAAYARLNQIRSEDIGGLLSEKQLEGVRDVMRQRLSDRFEESNRVYEQQIKRPTEEVIEKALASYTFSAGGWNQETGAAASALDVWNLIENSQLRGDDAFTWRNRLNSIIEAKKSGAKESDFATEMEASRKSTDPTVTPEQFDAWRYQVMAKGLLTIEDSDKYYGKKQSYWDDPYRATAAATAEVLVETEEISDLQATDALAKTELWADTPEGSEAIANNPAAFADRAEYEVGLKAIDNIVEENEGEVDKFKKAEYVRMNALVKAVREAAITADPTLEIWAQAVQITNAPEPELFHFTSISPEYDAVPMEMIRAETGFVPTAYGINAQQQEGYFVQTAPQVFDLFRIDEKGNVEFWDATDIKWRNFMKRRFKKK